MSKGEGIYFKSFIKQLCLQEKGKFFYKSECLNCPCNFNNMRKMIQTINIHKSYTITWDGNDENTI